MKAISAIVFSLFLGLGVGSAGKLVEQRDRQLVYELRGETVVGIPLKAAQGQAVRVDQTVKITRQDQRTFILQSENIVVNGLKNDLSDASKSSSSESSSSSREEQTLPLSKKIREILESPVEVIVTNQKVSAFRVKSGTPTWARNIFRGLLTHFHFVFEQMGDLPVGGSSPENEFEIEKQSSIFGTCPTKYKEYNLGPVGNSVDAVAKKLEQVLKEVHLDQSAQSQSSFESAFNESANSSSSSEELQQRLPQFVRNFNQETAKKMCEDGDKYMVILKILNMTGCSEVRSLSMGHPAVEVNNTNPLYERQVVILNFGCGMGPGDFKALGVLGADTLNVGFPQSELPSMKQVTTQISQLKEVREGKAQPPERPLLVQSLHYEFVQRLEAEPRRSAAESKSDSQSAENNEVEGGDSDEDLEHPGLSTLIIDPKNRGEDELAKILKENLREITKIFKESHPQDESLDVHKVMDLYRAVIRIVRLLPKTKLINVYSSLSVEGKSTNNRGLYTLYFNALLIAGTGPSLAAVDKFFRNDNIDPVQKAHYLISFPQYARRPTRALIRMFKETTEQALRKESQILRNSALLSLASVTYQACVNSRIGRAKYPVEIYGRGCGPNFARDEIYALLGEKLWPGIMASGNDEQKSVLITALSLLGLPDSVQLFEKVIQDEHQSDFIRTKAVFGYKRLIHSSNGNDAVSRHFVENTVIPNLLKHTEEVGGRDGRPSTVQMAAGSLLFVCEHSRIQEWDRVSTAAIKSRNPEVQKFVGTALTSIAEMNSPVNANHLRMKKIATEMVNKGVLSGAAQANAISMNIFRGTTINEKAELEFYSRFAALKSYKSNNDFLHLYSMGSYELGADPLSVTPLNIQLSFQATRAQDIWKSSKVYAQLSGWDSAFFATQLDAQSFTTFLKSTEAGRIFAIWLSEKENNGLRNQVERINVQKAIQPVELVKEVPTMMGYPVVFRTSNPLIFSTVGQIGIKGSQQNNRVQADLYISMGAQVKARLVAKVPYSMQEIEVGFEKNIAVELPFRLIAQKGREEGEVTIAVTPTHLENGGEPSGEIRVVSIDQLPFTAVVNDPLAKSLDEKYQKFQSIRTGSQIPREEFQFGKDSFGLNFNFEEERDKGTEHSLKFQKVLYKNQKVTLDLGQSRTNTIIISLAYGEAQNMDEQREEKDEISSSSSISGESTTQQSQSRTGGNIKNGLVVMGAVVGKKTFIPSLGQSGKPSRESKDVIEETQGQNKGKSTFQVLFKGISDKKAPQNVLVEVALGNAADEAAKYLPKIPGAEVVKRIITQADNSQEQSSLCFQIDHTARANSQPSQTNDWAATFKSQVRLGKSCNKLEEVEFRTVINNAMNEIKTRVQIKGVNGESGQLKAALSHLQNTLERSWENQSKHPRRSGLREVYSDDEGNVHLKWVVDNSLDRASLEERRAFATKPTRRPLHFDESPL